MSLRNYIHKGRTKEECREFRMDRLLKRAEKAVSYWGWIAYFRRIHNSYPYYISRHKD